MAELVDATDLESVGRKAVGVQLSPPGPNNQKEKNEQRPGEVPRNVRE